MFRNITITLNESTMEQFELKHLFNTTKEFLFKAWLDSKLHSEMTGGEADCSNIVGAKFSAWDGYIWGENITIEPNSYLKQSWRTSEFDDNDEDSILEIFLKETVDGTELTLIHTNIPTGQNQYEKGWVDNYFEPMQEYFSKKSSD